jgi:putative membrane protein
MLTLAAVAALAAAPAYAQNTPVRSRTEVQAPNQAQVRNRAVAGQNAAQQPAAGQVGNRPIAGQSVPEPAVGQVGAERGTSRFGTRAVASQAGVNDGLFAAAATDSNLSELSLSQLGVQKATDPELKQFSQRMIDEHTRMGREMRTMLAQKGLRVPEMVDVRSQFCAQSLAGLSGEQFDCCYAKAQLVAHMDSVAMFEAEAERGLDRDVKALAAKALPKIKSHLEMIKPIAKKYMKEKEAEERGHHETGAAVQRPIR